MNINPEQLFRLLCDPIRLRCVLLIQHEGSLCVCELTEALDMVQPKISRHLAMLRKGGLLQDERRGQWVHYRLHPELPDWARSILAAAAQGRESARLYEQDRQRLVRMQDRPSRLRCA
jgi:ArsR family transcriptional regulator, arsenate/arsenite/antimonite-responsive transcriptional repressor